MLEEAEKIVILIPSLAPDEKLPELVKRLREAGFSRILCVDDGSGEEYGKFFREAEEYGAVLEKHYVNLGKGRALKTGLNAAGNRWGDAPGVVAVDSDGQHSVEDTCRVAEELAAHPDSLIFGCRDFKAAGIPFKNRFGNILTSKLMAILCGIRLSDTQTGLRGFPMKHLGFFLGLKGERYEYEMTMILEAKEQGIPFREIPIQVIYINNNESSHFHIIRDSFRIYAQFGRFIFVALSSFVLDVSLFRAFAGFFKSTLPGAGSLYIMAATACARVISAVYNFLLNRKAVFRSDAPKSSSGVKYAVLAVCQLLLSGWLVTMIHGLTGGSETLIKIGADTVLFFLSFQIQRLWVFRKKVPS